jgi:hypothetical protein
MTAWYFLMSVLPWVVLIGGAVYLGQLWKRPGPEQLHRAEVDELREQVSLMRDFIRDAMQRIARLEEERSGGRPVGSGERPALPPPDADPPGPRTSAEGTDP